MRSERIRQQQVIAMRAEDELRAEVEADQEREYATETMEESMAREFAKPDRIIMGERFARDD